MPTRRCDRCGKEFQRKSHFDSHLRRKTPCTPLEQTSVIDVKKETVFWCTICNKSFSTKSNLRKHNNRKHRTTKVKSESDDMQENTYSCTHCHKVLARADSLKRHMKICTKRPGNEMVPVSDTSMIRQEQRTKAIINNVRDVNNNNVNIHNYFQVVNFDEEDLSYLTDKENKMLIGKGFKAVAAAVKKIHFSDDKPEHNNVYSCSYSRNIACVKRNGQWMTEDLDIVVEEMINKVEEHLEDKYDEYVEKDSIQEKHQKKFDRFLTFYNDGDEPVMEDMKKDIKKILYNNREMVKDHERREKLVAKNRLVLEYSQV